ncbi:AraC family transcriptional regulator [Jeongeupia naejangsanensis]|uniref:Helix-turn-helix transcriptional regulator n=1 Tax=Jeongeupia naejangsanensis TaxID=613195 RepID=A0ABS2BIP2_9NEIS|nr:helix-turn-helix transcriptional regulator [Jeongeupia naejangsanensis]MBM3115473.1 helix-turn-helix transcriptional regulator [Jeongeupia naejangsanensis]
MNQTLSDLDPDHYDNLPQTVVAMSRNYARGHDSGVHQHRRAQLVYACSGVMRVETAEGNWVLPPQRALWVPPQTPHRVMIASDAEMRTIYVEPAATPGLPVCCTVLEVSPLLRELILALTALPVRQNEGSRASLISILVIAELRELPTAPLHLPMPRDARLMRLCNYVLARLDGEETLEQLADLAGASSRTLARRFRSETGLSFREWRQQARLIRALEILAQGEPLKKVAERLGYASQSAFSAMFHRALGIEPSRYFAALPVHSPGEAERHAGLQREP